MIATAERSCPHRTSFLTLTRGLYLGPRKLTLAMMRHKGAPSWVRLNRFPVVDSVV